VAAQDLLRAMVNSRETKPKLDIFATADHCIKRRLLFRLYLDQKALVRLSRSPMRGHRLTFVRSIQTRGYQLSDSEGPEV
jgi:hypothetical protein